jgi:hypothetical protein
MEPNHPRWREFVSRLERVIVVSFEPLEWLCEGPGDFRHAEQVLREMGGEIDIAMTLRFFEDQGGIRDCGILDHIAWAATPSSTPSSRSMSNDNAR